MTDDAQHDEEHTAYPANESTPGQAESRAARRKFLEQMATECPWWDEYLELRLEGWDWRKATYIAWASSPMAGRWPATQQELATAVLGMRSDRTVRNWKAKFPEMDQRVAALQIAPLMQHRRDAIEALVESVKIVGNKGAPDRRTYFQMTGDLKRAEGKQPAPSAAAGAQTPAGSAAEKFGQMDEEQLEQAIRNMQAALGITEKEEDGNDNG